VNLKQRIKRVIPPALLNRTLLALPFLYRTALINYETNADSAGVADLLSQLASVLKVEGDVIECGSSRCGASIIMANALRAAGSGKKVYACDSFEGFDRAELRKEKEAGLTAVSERAFTTTSIDYVNAKLRALHVDDIVIPVKGYFKDTLPALGAPFCLAFIDCDLRESMIYCADTLWPRLPTGAVMIFDDYTADDFGGARLAVDEIVAAHRTHIASHGLLQRLYYVRKA
jgi:predicted O-methyltransferase YrrM